jgi:multiple sugar transport system substrate-binding protein
MKRFHTLVLSVSVLALLGGLISCNSSVGSSDSKSDSGSASSSTITINFWNTFSQTVRTYLRKKITSFQDLVKTNEGVDVVINESTVGSYDATFDAISRGMPTGNMPTIAVAYPDHIASYLAMEGSTAGKYVVNLSDYANSDTVGFGKESWIGDSGSDDFVKAFIEEGQNYTRKGMYSLPFMKSTEVLFYNQTMTSEILPLYDSTLTSSSAQSAFLSSMSWDKFMDLCEWIKNNYESKTSITDGSLKWPAYYDSDSNLFISKAYQNNGGYLSISDSGVGSVDFDSTVNRSFVSSLKSDFDNKLFTTKGVEGKYGSEYFQAGQVVFDIGSSGGAGYQALTSDNVGVTTAPVDNNNPLYVSQGPSLCLLRNPTYSDEENNKRVEYAWKFLKYLTSAEIDSYFCVRTASGYVPVRESAYKTDSFKTYLNDTENMLSRNVQVVTNDVAGHYLVQPYFSGSADARDEVGSIVTTVLNGSKTIDKAFSDAVNNTKKNMTV